MSDIDGEIERIDAGAGWDESDEVVELEVKRPLNKVVPVRLPSDQWEELRRAAEVMGIGPTTLARMWLLERLRETSASRSR